VLGTTVTVTDPAPAWLKTCPLLLSTPCAMAVKYADPSDPPELYVNVNVATCPAANAPITIGACDTNTIGAPVGDRLTYTLDAVAADAPVLLTVTVITI
jgi:hypothetical protein